MILDPQAAMQMCDCTHSKRRHNEQQFDCVLCDCGGFVDAGSITQVPPAVTPALTVEATSAYERLPARPEASPPPVPSTPAGPSIDELLAKAAELDSPRIARVAEKIGLHAQTLRSMLDNEAVLAKARAEVARLEAQLARAKAKAKLPLGRAADQTCPVCGKTGLKSAAMHRAQAHKTPPTEGTDQ